MVSQALIVVFISPEHRNLFLQNHIYSAADVCTVPVELRTSKFPCLLKSSSFLSYQGYTEKNKFIAAQGKMMELEVAYMHELCIALVINSPSSSIMYHCDNQGAFFLHRRSERRHRGRFLEDDMGAESSDCCHADKSERKERSE